MSAIVLERVIEVTYLSSVLALGGVGFVAGVIAPWPFRLIGYVVDAVVTLVR